EFNTKTEEIYAKGKVSVISSSVTSYSPETVFKQKERIIIMTGKNPQPQVIYKQEENKGDYKADKITFFLDKRKIFFENNVSGKVYLKD
ncbi:MAG: hypothetical protein NT145_04585, partial [Elusimicrobia bacterium]|nr:hypothetical protein [Elusimicrobiota bacterium]